MLIRENVICSHNLSVVLLVLFLLITILIAHYLLFKRFKTTISDVSNLNIQEFDYNSQETIETEIGTKATTIISFLPYEIREVIWDKKKCRIIFDDCQKIVRIMPKLKAGRTIEVRIITNTDKQQDLLLSVTHEKKGKIILIRNSIKSKKSIETKLI